jgi:hypothetical protein
MLGAFAALTLPVSDDSPANLLGFFFFRGRAFGKSCMPEAVVVRHGSLIRRVL